MNTKSDKLTFTVPLTLEAHLIAQQFHKQQLNSKKGKQVYLNTLAVYAVNFYLECLGFETDLEASDSWDKVMQSLTNTADLIIKEQGKLECVAVLPDAKVFAVPPEVWEDRIGYVAVQMNSELTEATLLGFVSEIATEELALSQLNSLEDLLKQLNQPIAETVINKPIQGMIRNQLTPELVKLSDWLHNIFDAGWETVETLFAPPQNELAMNFRRASSVKTSTSEIPEEEVKRGKLLGLKWGNEEMALLIGLKPTTSTEIDISVEVSPTGDQTYLPVNLQLMVLDETGGSVMQAKTMRSTENIRLNFSAEPGESFGIKVALGDVSITEEFLI
ncbi:MAG: DUF1822 family protein [Potamolinea sp.]